MGLANNDMMDAIFNYMDPSVTHTCEFHPAFLSRSSPHIAYLIALQGQVFSGEDPTPSRSARPGRPTRMPLSALPSPVSPHQPAPQRHGTSSIPSLPRGTGSKQNPGCGLSHAPVMCRYAFGLHTWLRTHIACYFCRNFTRISHKFHIIRILSRMCCTTNFARNSHEFHTNFTWQLHNSCRRSLLFRTLTRDRSTV